MKSKKVESDIFKNTCSGRETSRFTAKELDDETGLYYYGARYLNPRTSGWISSDPAGFELVNPMKNGRPKEDYSIIEANNWYSYTSNNPVNYTDPTGMDDIANLAKAEQDMNAKKFDNMIPPVNPDKPINRAAGILGLDYGANHQGAEKGSQKVDDNPSKIDCTELVAFANDSEIYRSWEMGDNPDYVKVDSPKAGDMKVWSATNPDTKETTGHVALITGESGNRALLHSDYGHGVRYSRDYVSGLLKKRGYSEIQIDYYRKQE